MSVKRSECQRRWRCSRLGSLKYRLTHRLYNTRDVEEELYQFALISEWLGRGRRGGVFTVPSALCVMQGSTEEAGTPCSFSTSSPGVFKALFLLRCGDYAAVTGLAHKFRTQSGRQIISSYCSQLAIQLSRPTASLFRLL